MSSKTDDLIFVEEPEAQLHISVQILMGLLLIAISNKKNLKFIFSTHSDTLILIIHFILKNKPSKDKIISIINNIYSGNNESEEHKLIDNFASAVADYKEDTELSLFMIEENRSKMLKDDEIETNIPGITDTLNKLSEWLFEIIKTDEIKNKDDQ